jgi:hypothetical protein
MTKIDQFYEDVLPPKGNYYLATNTPDSKLQQKKFSDRDTLVAALTLLGQTQRNVYFATGTFGNSRTLAEVDQKKCYYLDIDCGTGKHYHSTTNALLGIRQAIADKILPQYSYMMFTGHGLHIYWALEAPISREQWDIGAKNLKTICIENELGADNAITGDSARIMRAPNSSNVKRAEAVKSCQIVANADLLHPTHLFRPKDIKYPDILAQAVGGDDLTKMQYSEVSSYSRGMFQKCGVMRRSLVEQGANDTEPLWNNIINTLSFTEDGAKFIQAVSEGHRGYSRGETLEKYQQKLGGSSAPTTCETFSGLDSCGNICSACEHKVTTPVMLGREEPAAQIQPAAVKAAALVIPEPWSIGPEGLRRYVGDDEDGRPKFEPTLPPNYSHQLLNLIRCANVGGEHMYKLVVLSVGGDTEIPFIDEMHDQKAWDKRLGNYGMVMTSPFNTRFRGFILGWLAKLQDAAATASQRHFGWSDDHSTFAIGETIFSQGVGSVNHMVDKVMADKYAEVGTISEWIDKANKVITDRPESAAILATSLAAPLVGFTGDPGCVFSAHGESGTGKTTIMKIAQAMWGHPVKGMMSLDDTTNSMLNSLGVMRNLPAYWDEVRSSKEDGHLMKVVFRLSAGRERTRLTQNVQQRAVAEWQTILVTSSNISAMGTVANETRDSDAGIMRIFEITVPDIINSLGDLKVTKCYGSAGRVYAAYLSEHTDAVTEMVEQTEIALRKSLETTEPERFRVALLASMIVGAELGNKVLGLKFDMTQFIAYLKQEFTAMRDVSKGHREQYAMNSLLMRFINDMTPNRLVTDKMKKRGGGSVTTLGFPRNAAPIYVHIAQSGVCMVSKPQFDEWVDIHVGIKSHKVKEEINKLAGAKVIQKTLGSGTSHAAGRAYVYEIDMTHTSWKGMFDPLYAAQPQASNVAPISP